MEKAALALEDLETRLRGPRCRFRERAAVVAAAENLLAEAGSERWLTLTVSESVEETFQQEHRGRPGTDTRYVRTPRKRFHLKWEPKRETMDYDAQTDGLFPLITNDDKLSAVDLLKKYKYQPQLGVRLFYVQKVPVAGPPFSRGF
jgi:hypothetical protein